MKTEIFYAPSYSLAVVSLAPGEVIQAESGAMVSMTEGVDMQTSSKGGLVKGLKRAALGGESMFINTFTAQREAKITMAPAFPGDVRQMRLEHETMYVQSGSYMASTGDIDIDTKWGGAKTFFSGEGFFLLKLTGTQTRSAHALAGWLAPLLPTGSDSASKGVSIGGFRLGGGSLPPLWRAHPTAPGEGPRLT